jgi:tRNA(fMet)-specific endonuclease VapC
MPDYLLDTNACIALINGNPERVRTRFAKAIDAGAKVWVPAVVLYELWYGVAKSARPEENTRRVETFVAGPIQLLAFDEKDVQPAGVIRAGLEYSGKPIGAYDVLIAGQAVCRGLTLVTANAREFRRVKNLKLEDWAAAR